jgi:hypothetical protein
MEHPAISLRELAAGRQHIFNELESLNRLTLRALHHDIPWFGGELDQIRLLPDQAIGAPSRAEGGARCRGVINGQHFMPLPVRLSIANRPVHSSIPYLCGIVDDDRSVD